MTPSFVESNLVLQLVAVWINRCDNASGFSENPADDHFGDILPSPCRRRGGIYPMTGEQRSGCPINLTLEVVGDRWSLLVIRDMMFGNRRHFRELLTKSEEGISSNILADRLKTLLDQGIVTREDDPSHKQKGIYSLTEQGIELLPILAQMSGWGYKYLPVSEELGIRAKLLGEGGPKMWAEFMDELREKHLGAKRKRKAGPSVGERLQAAFERVVAKKQR
jgi:DNA-binding HxlR family transcriptional regulator